MLDHFWVWPISTIPRCTCFQKIAAPLTEFTKSDKLHWSLEAKKSFDALKIALSTTPVMAVPDPSFPFVVMTDASD